MIEQLNHTMTQCLRTCIDEQKDWIVILQSITMSYRSTRHNSTGKSPYEMMFRCRMHLPFKLKTNPFTSVPQHIHNDDLGEILPESTMEEIAEKFTVIDKIRTVIHDVASDEIAQSQLKQAKYYDSHHCGSKLNISDKVLHYNCKAAQQQGDKTAPHWIGPYTIVKVHNKGNYTIKDKNGHQLATKMCASNLLKLWQEPIASDFLPDWIKPSLIPDTVSKVKPQLDEAKKQKQNKQAIRHRRRKPNQMTTSKNYLVMTSLPLPVNSKILNSKPVYSTPNVFKHEMEQCVKKNMKEKKSTLQTTFPSTLFHQSLITLYNTSHQQCLTPPKPVWRLGLRMSTPTPILHQ